MYDVFDKSTHWNKSAQWDVPSWDKPPPGYKPGQTRAPLIYNIVVPMAAIAITLACLRLYVRACIVKVVGKDDWLLLAAVVMLSGLVSAALWGVTVGIGLHQYDLIREVDPIKALPVCFPFFYMFIVDSLHLGLAICAWKGGINLSNFCSLV